MVKNTLQVPDGINPFLYYDEHGAIEDLADILQAIRSLGFGNQYETDESYRKGLVYLLPADEFSNQASSLSGYYTRNTDQVRASAVYIPGHILFGFYPEEAIFGGGFAVLVDGANYTETRPVSTNFMLKNYIYTTSGKNVGIPGHVQIAFHRGYPLYPFSRQVHAFLEQIQNVNQQLQEKCVHS